MKVNDVSDRRIVFINETGEFVRNGKRLEVIIFLSKYTSLRKFTPFQIRELGGELNHFHEKALDLNEKSTSQFSILKIQSKFKHEVNLEIAKLKYHISMNTDYNKAKKLNFYEKEYIIERFDGPKKVTTALEMPKTELELMGPIYKKPIINEVRGSIDSSFNPHLASDKFISVVEKMKEFDAEWNIFISSYGIEELDANVLKHHLFSIDEVFDWDLSK